MKSTGILRRIDDLGRIVIPKEIRKHLRIRDGEYLEIFINEETIILKKHSMINVLDNMAQLCVGAINDVINSEIIIADRDKVVAVSPNLKKKYLGKKITEHVEEVILRRESFASNEKIKLNVVEETSEEGYIYIYPIIASGDSIGLIMLLSYEKDIVESDKKIITFLSNFISKYIE